jgi:replicative DNA helicase
VRVLSLGTDDQLETATPSAFVDDGRKPVFRVRTRLGREVRTTLTHPFLTPAGWQPLGALCVGDAIAVPTEIPVFGLEPLPEAGTLGEACGAPDGTTPRVPQRVFRAPRADIAQFLNRLLGAGASLWFGPDGPRRVEFATRSPEMARDVQHLLLRFGVSATLRRSVVGVNESAWCAYEVSVVEAADLARLARDIGIAGRDAELAQLAHAATGARVLAHAGAPAAVEGGGMPADAIVPSAIRWDSIVAVEACGTDQVYDLTVPRLHNFVANDVFVHNTSFALGAAAHAAIHADHRVLIFSLEMGALELSQRLLCAEARIDSSKVRNGRLSQDDWGRISQAMSRLSAAPIWIDDNPNTTVMEIRAKARRLRSQVGSLGMVVVDYLQLMTGRTTAENRQVEVAEISRGLKILAREIETPVVALSQLSRNLELRADKRPMLADLRESGCLTGDARVSRADTGAEVTMAELMATGERDIPVWSLDRDLRLVSSTMSHVFPTGTKEVFAMKLASGRRITASANHPFLTVEGWARLDELGVGRRIALPRSVPEPAQPRSMPIPEIVMLAHLIGDGCVAPRQPVHYTSADPACLAAVEDAAQHFGITPRRVARGNWWHVYLPAPYRLTHGKRNPIQRWLATFGLDGKRSYEKFVPRPVFALPRAEVALFLRHLWSTDGSVVVSSRSPLRIYYATTSQRLADDVATLLQRFGIVARVRTVPESRGRTGYTVDVSGSRDQRTFLDEIGVFGARAAKAALASAALADVEPNPNRDTVPAEVWGRVKRRMADTGMSARALASGLGTAYCGSTLYKHSPSRGRLGRVAALLDDPVLESLASSDVFWDEVVEITSLGEQPVFDATVRDTHNFIANGIVVENSLEQDADVVIFIYRDDVYHQDSPDRGQAEVIVAKHRNGPTGITRLAFLEHYTRFANMSRNV